MFELFKTIVANIWSYSSYVVIGSFAYILYNIFFIYFLKIKSKRILLIILYIFGIACPLCNCFAISFVLYKDLYSKEDILRLYIVSSFLKIHAFFLLYSYFGMMGMLVYLLITILIVSSIGLRIGEKKYTKNINYIYFKDSINPYILFNNIRKLFLIYFIGIVISSLFQFIFKIDGLLLIIDNGNRINITQILYYTLFSYICIPNSLIEIITFLTIGISLQKVIFMLFVGLILNIHEIFVLFIYYKSILKTIIMMILTVIIISYAIPYVFNYMNINTFTGNMITNTYYEIFLINLNSLARKILSLIFVIGLILNIFRESN